VSSSPLVTVIIPVYDRGYCLIEAVNSVLEQTHRNLECIVVDDGSRDNSYELAVAAAAADPRLRVFTQDNAGVSAARNHGLREARGEYVTFLDSDDLMTPFRVRRQLELLAETGCDAVVGECEIFAVGGAALPTWQDQKGTYTTSILLRTSDVRAVGGYDESLRYGEDVDLIVKLQGAGCAIHASEETFVVRRYHGDNLTYDLSLVQVERAMLSAARRHLARRRAADSGA